jgi:hypothetical protein
MKEVLNGIGKELIEKYTTANVICREYGDSN